MFDLKTYTAAQLRSAIAATRRSEERFREAGNLHDAIISEQVALDLEAELATRKDPVR